jgi:hypothetical protein
VQPPQAFKICFDIELKEKEIIYLKSCGEVEGSSNEFIHKYSFHVLINNCVHLKTKEHPLFIKCVHNF